MKSSLKFQNIIYLILLQSTLIYKVNAQVGLYPDIAWQKSLGGSESDFGIFTNVTSDGGYISVTTTYSDNGEITFNHGLSDFWLVKLDSLRNIEWEHCYGGEWWEYAGFFIEVSDGYLLNASTRSHDGDVGDNYGDWYVDYWALTTDAWLIKIDFFGNIQWEQNYGGEENDGFVKIIPYNDGDFIIAGAASSYDHDVVGNHGGWDAWIVKIDSVGNLLYQNTIGGSEDDYLSDMKTTNDGGYIACGSTYSNDFDAIGNHGLKDAWIVKLDANGEMTWQKELGGSNNEDFEEIIQTDDKGYIAVGYSTSADGDLTENKGSPDWWVVKLDSIGTIEWQKSLGGSHWDLANSIIEVTNGYVITGSTESIDGDIIPVSDQLAIWIIEINDLGEIIWQYEYGGSDWESSDYIKLTEDGGYLIQASTASDDGPITEIYGGIDNWILKLKPECIHYNYFADYDEDGYGNNFVDTFSCNIPIGFVLDSTDCNDANNLIYPFAEDICNSIDDNCNGEIDEDAVFILQYADGDGDGFGDILNDSTSCFEITGYVIDNTDCNDSDALINPASIETCNLLDDNCNALIDEGLILYTFYADADDDNYGDADATIISCFEDVPGYVSDSTDCDDTNNLIYPGAAEICNYLDDDCDGVIDDNLSYIYSYQDADGDDFGNIEIDSFACTIPDGFVEDDSDCDDTNPEIYPGAEETLNDVDDNCNALIDEGLQIENNLLSEIKIYPNPATNILQIDYSGNETGMIEILNIAGEIIYSDKLTAHLTINIQNLPEGIYLLKITSTEYQGVFNFVKE